MRYNTFHLHAGDSSLDPWFDVHGNQTGGVFGSMGAEIYGNRLTTESYQVHGIAAFSIRGGRTMIFFNNIRPSDSNPIYGASLNTMEQLADNTNVTYSPTLYDCTGSLEGKSCASDGETQHIGQSYWWNNRIDSYYGSNSLISQNTMYDCALGIGVPADSNCEYNGHGVAAVLENTNWWQDHATERGAQAHGIGCGTLASRPSTCTTGVGYWATNQSCTTVDDAQTGASPSAPITGILYKCTSTNTWTAYYTPYTYPHPLITDCTNNPVTCDQSSDTTPPAPPIGLSVQ